MKGCLKVSLGMASPCSYIPVGVLNMLEMWIRALSLLSSDFSAPFSTIFSEPWEQGCICYLWNSSVKMGAGQGL